MLTYSSMLRFFVHVCLALHPLIKILNRLLPSGDLGYSARWRIIKRSVSLACASEYHRDETDLSRHIDYYFNPVKHGLVARVCDWQYSTFHRDVEKGIYPRDWGGGADDLAFEVGEP